MERFVSSKLLARLSALGALLWIGVVALPSPGLAADAVQVSLETTKGTILLELNSKKAPKTVANFVQYVKEGAYDGTIFHRVIPNFMIQGGGFDKDLVKRPTHAPIPNEADNGLDNDRGTIAMARTSDPNSATNQFFINVVDNKMLNFTAKTPRGWGYAVFGKVVKGMDVVDAIKSVKTGACGRFQRNCPTEAIVIKKASVVSK